jgi:hypothetical protein
MAFLIFARCTYMVSIPINNFRAVAFRGQSLFRQCSNLQLTLAQFSHGCSYQLYCWIAEEFYMRKRRQRRRRW